MFLWRYVMKNIFTFILVMLFINSVHSQYVVRVLVAYTTDMFTYNSDPLAILDANFSHINNVVLPQSNITNVTFEMVCAHKSSYTQTANTWTDRNRFRTHGDGFLDEVTTPNTGLRDLYDADVCFLAMDINGSYNETGIAYGIGVAPANAFAVGIMGVAGWEENMIHEIGHLFGARHETDYNTTPYSDGHGYLYTATDGSGINYRTVMCSALFPNRSRFSSPTLTDLSETIGSATRDNRSVMIGRLTGTHDYSSYGPMDEYRTAQSTVNLTSESLEAYEQRKAIATSTININSSLTVNKNSRFTALVTSTPFNKRQNKNVLSHSKNTTFNMIVLNSKVQMDAIVEDVSLSIYDLKGRLVFNQENCFFAKKWFDLSFLTRGFYIVNVKDKNANMVSAKFNNMQL
jgi:hypothetical protein